MVNNFVVDQTFQDFRNITKQGNWTVACNQIAIS